MDAFTCITTITSIFNRLFACHWVNIHFFIPLFTSFSALSINQIKSSINWVFPFPLESLMFKYLILFLINSSRSLSVTPKPLFNKTVQIGAIQSILNPCFACTCKKILLPVGSKDAFFLKDKDCMNPFFDSALLQALLHHGWIQ